MCTISRIFAVVFFKRRRKIKNVKHRAHPQVISDPQAVVRPLYANAEWVAHSQAGARTQTVFIRLIIIGQ